MMEDNSILTEMPLCHMESLYSFSSHGMQHCLWRQMLPEAFVFTFSKGEGGVDEVTWWPLLWPKVRPLPLCLGTQHNCGY